VFILCGESTQNSFPQYPYFSKTPPFLIVRDVFILKHIFSKNNPIKKNNKFGFKSILGIISK
jgi:hypothetical protein